MLNMREHCLFTHPKPVFHPHSFESWHTYLTGEDLREAREMLSSMYQIKLYIMAGQAATELLASESREVLIVILKYSI